MGVFKLGKMTFGSLFKKPSTVCYPFEKKDQPVGLKGQIAIEVDKCILCGLCERSCTTGCISVSKPEKFWEINRYGCIQCGYCVTVCPKACLQMEPDYAPCVTEQVSDRFSVPYKDKAKPKKEEKLEPPSDKQVQKNMNPSVAEVQELEAADDIQNQSDYQVEDLLRLMDDGMAHKVREKLYGTGR